MATIALPDWLEPQTLVPPTLQRATLSSVGRYSQATDIGDLIGGDTWAMSLGLAPHRHADSPRLQALVNQLVGGLNVLSCHHFGSPVPRGTLRGNPSLSTAMAFGSQTMAVAGALSGSSLISGGSFEIDTNADGIADGWAAYSNGTTGTITRSVSTNTATSGSKAQLVQATGLGTTSNDRVGVVQVLALAGATGDQVSVAVDALGGASSKVRLFVQAIDTTAGNALRGTIDVAVLQNGAWGRLAGTLTASGAFDQLQVFVWNTEMPVAGASTMYLDSATVARGALAVAFAFAGVKAGDMLGLGNALFQVAQDTDLNDAGAGSIAVVNKARATIASATPVIWNKPAALWRLAGTPQMMLQPGASAGVQLDLVEKAF